MKLGIREKVLVNLVILMLLAFMNAAAIFKINKLQKNDGLLVNLAGRQRMLSQKMSKNTFLYVLNKNKKNDSKMEEKIIKELKGAMALYEETISAFINGGEITTGIGKKRKIKDIGKNIPVAKKANELWKKMEMNIDKVIEKTDLNAGKFVYENNNKLLTLSNDVVTALQKNADKKVALMKRIQIYMIIISILVFIISVIIINKVLINPIKTISEELKNIANGEGDLTSRMENNQKDEIGELARHFNKFVNNLDEIISNTKNVTTIVSNESKDLMRAMDNIVKGKNSSFSDEMELKIDGGIEHLNEMVEDILDKVRNQTAGTEESLAGLEEIAATGQNIKVNAERTLKLQREH